MNALLSMLFCYYVYDGSLHKNQALERGEPFILGVCVKIRHKHPGCNACEAMAIAEYLLFACLRHHHPSLLACKCYAPLCHMVCLVLSSVWGSLSLEVNERESLLFSSRMEVADIVADGPKTEPESILASVVIRVLVSYARKNRRNTR